MNNDEIKNEHEDIQTQDESQEVDSTESSEEETKAQDSRIEALEAKIKDLENEKLRIYADFENTKRRLEREKTQTLEYAHEAILKDLLPIFDSMDRALEITASIENSEKIVEGLKLVLDNLQKILGKHGAEPIDCTGEFDPNLHDAIMQAPNPDKNDGEINQALQRGFTYKQRVLRPAMVSVVKN